MSHNLQKKTRVSTRVFFLQNVWNTNVYISFIYSTCLVKISIQTWTNMRTSTCNNYQYIFVHRGIWIHIIAITVRRGDHLSYNNHWCVYLVCFNLTPAIALDSTVHSITTEVGFVLSLFVFISPQVSIRLRTINVFLITPAILHFTRWSYTISFRLFLNLFHRKRLQRSKLYRRMQRAVLLLTKDIYFSL